MSSRFLLANDEPFSFVLNQLENCRDGFFVLARYGRHAPALPSPTRGERQLRFGEAAEAGHEDNEETNLVHIEVLVFRTGD